MKYNWTNINTIITGNYFKKYDFVSVCQKNEEFDIIRDSFDGEGIIESKIKSNIYDCLKKQEFSVFESDNNKKLVYEFLSELKIRNNGVFREFPITDGNKEDKKQFLCENFNKYYKIGEIKPEFVKLPKLFVNQKSNFEITLNSIGLLPINASINSLSSFEKEILDNIVSNITIKTALELQKTNEYNTNFTSNELIISNNEKARWKLDFTPLKHEINLKYQIKINIDSSICSAILTQKYDFEEKLTCETKTLKETYEISHGRITDTFKDTMVINTFYTGKVIIADIKLSEKEFLKNLPKTAKTNIKDINIGKRMEVVLKNENEDNNNFEVVKHNEHKEQPIINGMRTEWSFKVKPLKLGLHTLILSGAIVFKDKDGDIHKEAVYTKKIEVIVKGQQVEQNENNTEQNEHKQSNKIQKITVDAFFIKDIDRLIELVDNTNENKFEIKKACLIDELTNLKNKKLDNVFIKEYLVRIGGKGKLGLGASVGVEIKGEIEFDIEEALKYPFAQAILKCKSKKKKNKIVAISSLAIILLIVLFATFGESIILSDKPFRLDKELLTNKIDNVFSKDSVSIKDYNKIIKTIDSLNDEYPKKNNPFDDKKTGFNEDLLKKLIEQIEKNSEGYNINGVKLLRATEEELKILKILKPEKAKKVDDYIEKNKQFRKDKKYPNITDESLEEVEYRLSNLLKSIIK